MSSLELGLDTIGDVTADATFLQESESDVWVVQTEGR
jgi:hypothetical protein